jgi:hypothetical protein
MLALFASLTGVFLLAAFVCCILAAMNRLHVWVAVLLLIIANLLSFGGGALVR